MLIGDAVVGVDADERVVIVVRTGGGRCIRGGAPPCWTFVVKVGPGTGKMMVIGVLIYECTLVSSLPGMDIRSGVNHKWRSASQRTLEGAALAGTSLSATRFFLRLTLLAGFSDW